MHLLSYKSVDQTSDPICTPFADIYSQKTCEDSNSRHQESTSDHHTGCCSRFQDQRAPNPDGHNTSGYRRNAGNTNRKNHCRNSEDHRTQHCKNKCQKCQGWNNQSGGWNQSQNGWDNQQNGWNQNQNSWDNQQNGWNQNQNSWDNQQNGWNQNQNGWDNQQNVWGQTQQEPDCLFAPATIRIIEEEGGYTGGQDAFFLNGRPICSLQPGSEYTFTTYAKKNVLTIGRPTPEPSDETTVLKFIAGEKGQIEIHACAGRLLPGKFSNYTA